MRPIWLVLLVACEKPAEPEAADGAALYGMYCASCHGPKGKPDATMVARLGVRDLTSTELRARITPALVEQQIRKGSQNKLMPAFEGGLAPDSIKAIADYVASATFLQR